MKFHHAAALGCVLIVIAIGVIALIVKATTHDPRPIGNLTRGQVGQIRTFRARLPNDTVDCLEVTTRVGVALWCSR